MAYHAGNVYIITTGTSTNTDWVPSTDNKITLYPSRRATTGTTNGVDFNFAAVYDPMETCMWCGEYIPRSQVDEHEESCGE